MLKMAMLGSDKGSEPLLDRGGLLPLLGRTSARELCHHHPRDAQELLSSLTAAVLGCSHTSRQEPPVRGREIHPLSGFPQAQGLPDNVLPLLLPPKGRMQHRRSLRLCSPWSRERDVPLGTKHPINATREGRRPTGKRPPKSNKQSGRTRLDTPLGAFCSGANFYSALKIKQNVAKKTSGESFPAVGKGNATPWGQQAGECATPRAPCSHCTALPPLGQASACLTLKKTFPHP